MNKLLKIAQTLIFTILILLVIVFIWQFFNNYAQLLFLPLGCLCIYYLLIYLFSRLFHYLHTIICFYVIIIFIFFPLFFFSMSCQAVFYFSYIFILILIN